METNPRISRSPISDGVAVLVMDDPPLNTGSEDFMAEMRAAVGQALADKEIRAIVLTGSGRNFFSGADATRLLGMSYKSVTEKEVKRLQQFFNSIEQGPKPVIAAINCNCLDNGLELALACHYRVAEAGAAMGLTQVNMGVIPGCGTQRMPRIIGLTQALDLMTNGKVIPAEQAFRIQLVDELAPPGDLVNTAVAAAKKFINRGLNFRLRMSLARFDRLPSAMEKKAIIEDAKAKLAKKAKGYIAPFKLVEALEKGLSTHQEDDLLRDAQLFSHCALSDVCRNLVGLWRRERASGNLPRIKGLTPDKPAKVGVLGGGVMGSGIVHLLLNAGLGAVLWDVNDQALEKARQSVARTYAFQIKKGKMKLAQLARLMDSKLTTTTNLEDLRDVDLVIEAVLENMAVKQDLWKKLEGLCRPEVIFGTNTSALPITEMASALANPSRMLGLHFFNPAERMPLVEIICARQTSDQTLASGVGFTRMIRKVPVVVNDGPGFYVTRQLISLPSGAIHLLADGVDMVAIDRAVTNFGLPMGPFTLEDLTGLDIGYHVGETLARTLGERYTMHPLHTAIYKLGDYGRKTGRGFYDYSAKPATPNPRVRELVADYLEKNNVQPRQANEKWILDSLMALAINEAALMIEEGICDRPADMDLAMVHGAGFPPYRGGILRHADKWGAANVYKILQELHQRLEPRFAPADLIKRMAEENGAFYQN